MSGSSDEVKDASGERDEADAEIAQLQAELNQPSERELKQRRLTELEAARAATRLAQLTSVAGRRRLGIKKDAAQIRLRLLDEDERRVIEVVEAAIKTIEAAVQTINDRYEQYEGYRAEDDALADRFGGPASDLARVPAPAVREGVIAVCAQLQGCIRFLERTDRFKPQVEADETGLRQRRTYAEVTNSPAFSIITDAGLKPFDELTARQREIIAEREQAQVQARKQLEQLPRVPDDVPPGGY